MSRYTDLFINRPVLASAISFFILLLGIFATTKLPLRLYPEINIPVITIQTTYAGANPQAVAASITSVLEDALTGIENLDYITASSSEGYSQIKIHFKAHTNPKSALEDVISQISSATRRLPDAADKPVIQTIDRNSSPIVVLAFTSQSMNNEQIYDYLERVIKPKIETINGVSEAHIIGSQYTMRLWLNPTKMAALNVSSSDVLNALLKQNVESAAGATEGKSLSFNLKTTTGLTTAKQFNQLIINKGSQGSIRLQDIGHAELGSDTDIYSAFFNGQRATAMFILPLASANILSVANHISQLLPDIKKELPYDLKLHVAHNAATYIKESLYDIVETLIIALMIVIFIMFFSLGTVTAALIPIVTIPLSLIGVCFWLWLVNYSFNLLTLLAMVLAIGLVVDDAIIIVENIFRYIELGLKPLEASIKGTRELASPIIAMTLTLAAVFSPIGFMEGVTGQLFAEFAFTLAISVILSGVIALTLSPMMCSKLLSVKSTKLSLVGKIDYYFDYLRKGYGYLLSKLVNYRKTIIIIWLTLIALVVYCYITTPKQMTPKEDYGFLTITGQAPNNASPDYIKKQSNKLNNILKPLSAVNNYLYVNGWGNGVTAFVELNPLRQRKLKSQQLQSMIQQKLDNIPGLDFTAILPKILPGHQSNDTAIQFVLTSTDSYQSLATVAQELQVAGEKNGVFLASYNDASTSEPQLQLTINRIAANALGISMDKIASVLGLMLGDETVQQFTMNDHRYDVIIEADRKARLNPELINQLPIATASGKLVPLSSIVSMKMVLQPISLNQFQKQNAVTISASLTPDYTLSQALNFLKQQANQLLPKGMSYHPSGATRRFLQEGHHMLAIFALAIIIIFLVLAIQFESYRNPFIILLGSVPLSLFGALIFLKLGFATINIYSQLSLLTLIGLISKHGILLTKFANDLCHQKAMSAKGAIISAAQIRLRPILMTTIAMICSAIPLMLGQGSGHNSRFAIGIVITSGMLIGTFLTLFVLPVLYLLITNKDINK